MQGQQQPAARLYWRSASRCAAFLARSPASSRCSRSLVARISARSRSRSSSALAASSAAFALQMHRHACQKGRLLQ